MNYLRKSKILVVTEIDIAVVRYLKAAIYITWILSSFLIFQVRKIPRYSVWMEAGLFKFIEQFYYSPKWR